MSATVQVDEAVSSKKSKKDKKKAKNKAKTSVNVEDGGVKALQLSLDMMHTFTLLSLPTPVNTDDVDSGIEGLEAKKLYLQEQGKTGIKLKELLAKEKAERLAKKNGAAEKAAAEVGGGGGGGGEPCAT